MLGVGIHATQSKRGFVVTNTAQPDLEKYLASPLLTWAYNYGSKPVGQGSTYPYGNLSFVPMLWGGQNSESFLSTITSEPNYHYVLAFNEPDMRPPSGSNMLVSEAVSIWNSQIQPLSSFGYKLGSPAGNPQLHEADLHSRK